MWSIVTRLIAEDIAHVERDIAVYDLDLRARTGLNLAQVGCRAVGFDEQCLETAAARLVAAAVTITTGRGTLHRFAETVRAIVSHLGFRAFVPDAVDVDGVASAVDRGADIVFMADDDRFIALALHAGVAVDNAAATGKGFAAALDAMAGGLAGRQVLLLGAGRVGAAGAAALRQMGACATIVDPDQQRARAVARRAAGTVAHDLRAAVESHRILFDASPARGVVHARDIRPDTYVAAPGMPCGLTPAAESRIGPRLLHDPLQIGVATMAVAAAAICSERGAEHGGARNECAHGIADDALGGGSE
jgi:pyrrolysine biosynthesis protein PylD